MDDLPKKICEWLDEPPCQLPKIEEIWLRFGQRILLKTYFMTYVVELYGGLMTNEDERTGIFRRRTPGGTFYTMFKCVNMKEDLWISRFEYLKKHRFAYKHERARKYSFFERKVNFSFSGLGEDAVRERTQMAKINVANLKREGMSDCLCEFDYISIKDLDLDHKDDIQEMIVKRYLFLIRKWLQPEF